MQIFPFLAGRMYIDLRWDEKTYRELKSCMLPFLGDVPLKLDADLDFLSRWNDYTAVFFLKVLELVLKKVSKKIAALRAAIFTPNQSFS